MKLKLKENNHPKACQIPRKQEAIEALLMLAWKKEKKDRPYWLIKELSSYC